MNTEMKAKWVEALRSGKYTQGKGSLHPGNCFCCLGVLCDLIDPTKWSADYAKDVLYDGCAFSWIPGGLRSDLGIPGAIETELATMNDTGRTFTEIANYIEATL